MLMKEVKKLNYLFVFFDDTFYEADNLDKDKPPNFKNALIKAANYLGCDTDLFLKSLNGFEDDDIDGMIKLFNFHSNNIIADIYIIDKKLYGK